MADENDVPPEELEDLGEPIAELRTLAEEPTPGFVFRLVNSLRRRDLSSQLATLSWIGLGAVLVEFIRMIFSFLDNPQDRGGSD